LEADLSTQRQLPIAAAVGKQTRDH